MPIGRNSFIQMTKLSNVKGRITYISSHAKQENLYAVYETTERKFWRELAKCNQDEFVKSGTEGKCIEARELIIALPESFTEFQPDRLLQLFTNHFKQNYGTECIAALHHNKRKTNYHIHLIFAERKLLDEPIIKTASRNMFYDENGKHVRTKGYIETMLDENNNSDEAIIFKKNLKDLQAALVNAAIVTQERDGINQQISFSEIAINNPKRVAEGDYRVTHYKVQRTNEKISTLVHKKNDPTMIYFQFEQKKYDETELDVHADFLRLGIEQQGQCKAFYKEICPYVIESVLTRDKDNKVEFIAERSQVSRGIIEVLYLLRCSLMHGEVFPDNNAMEVYKYAYSILAAILKKMF